MTRLRVALTAAALAATSLFVVGTPTRAGAAAAEQHCAWVLPATEVLRCWPTLAEARQFAVEHGALGAPSTGRLAAVAGASSLTLLSIEYAGTFDTGDSLWIYGKNGGCSNTMSDLDYGAAGMPWGWGNRIDSFKAYNLCVARHYAQGSYVGQYTDWSAGEWVLASGVGGQVSSIQWT